MKRIVLIIGLALLGAPLLASAGRVFVGVGVGVGYPYGYGYGPYYSPYYYPYYPYYYAPPEVVYQPPVATVTQPPAAYWYYCPPAKAYFPYVKECPVSWEAVPAAKAPPRQAAAAPAPSGRVTYTLGDVLFETAKSDLEPAATATLDGLVASLNKEPNSHIVIEGYTDNAGKRDYNRELSQRRADAVMQYLIAHGIAADRLTAVGKGESSPVASNATADGRRQNRRVNIVVG
jgi:outer membrane protein OmpA-like peptidoglycan-associated protein